MELTLAEEIRALLEMHQKESPQPRGKCFMQFWDAFPALAAKMLAVIDERVYLEKLVASQKYAISALVACKTELEADRDPPLIANAAAGRIAELKEDAVRWETRYKFMCRTVDQLVKECGRLRWEAECLQVTVR